MVQVSWIVAHDFQLHDDIFWLIKGDCSNFWYQRETKSHIGHDVSLSFPTRGPICLGHPAAIF